MHRGQAQHQQALQLEAPPDSEFALHVLQSCQVYPFLQPAGAVAAVLQSQIVWLKVQLEDSED
jgi:hypothetical protein